MPSPRRPRVADPLTVERIVDRGIEIADRDGLNGLSMRRLGAELGTDPMAVYHHVADKQRLLGLMGDRIVGGIEPVLVGDWPTALRATVMAARRTMLAHPWVAQVLADAGGPGPGTLVYIDAIFGILRRGGLSLELTHHAIHLLGSRVLGFSQDLFDDKASARPDDQQREAAAAGWEASLPYVAEMARGAEHDGALGGCDDDVEFAFALDIIIEGLQRRA